MVRDQVLERREVSLSMVDCSGMGFIFAFSCCFSGSMCRLLSFSKKEK